MLRADHRNTNRQTLQREFIHWHACVAGRGHVRSIAVAELFVDGCGLLGAFDGEDFDVALGQDGFAGEVSCGVLHGDGGDLPWLLGHVDHPVGVGLEHERQGVGSGVDGGDDDLGAAGFVEGFVDADGGLVPAGDVDGVEFALGVALEQVEGLLAGVFGGVGEFLGEFLDDGDLGVGVVEDVAPVVIAVAAERQDLAEGVEHGDVAGAADGVAHVAPG